MASVLQNGSRKRRPWTAQDQTTAEVAAACGVSCREIGKVLKRDHSVIRRKLSLDAAEKNLNVIRRWQQVNQGKSLESLRRWRKQNPLRRRELNRKWKRENPESEREQVRSRNAWKRAARRQSLHPVTRQQIDARFGLWDHRCAFCGVDATHQRNHGRQRLTVEHVLALTKDGLDEAANIIPACTACNSSKNNSPIEDWYRQQEWFTEPRWAKIRKHCPAAVVGQLPLALAA
jgi:5-methylcytosine-specific restriction endonuclease McrA